MKILHLSTLDLVGGAARAAYRVHRGLVDIGVNSQMLVRYKSSKDKTVIAPKSYLERGLGELIANANQHPINSYKHKGRNSFSPQWLGDGIRSKINHLNSDIVNLHWVGRGFIQIETLAKLKQPLVWTLMDMWSFTGGCYYTDNCDRYTQSCGKCPMLSSDRDDDLSQKVWNRKIKAWQNLNLTLVAPTQWMAKSAAASSVFKNQRIEVIPFCLDTNVFKPIDKQVARKALNLPLDKKLVLFGALNATQDQRKGFHLLQPALQQLAKTEWNQKIEVVVFGASPPEIPLDLGFNAHYLGKINDDIALALVYAAADVMIAPSVQEAFGQTASESIACGTPIIAFADTGLADIVEHQNNGYLVKPYEIDDLARGIIWVLENEERHQKLSDNARKKAESDYPLELQARRYETLYAEILRDCNALNH
ncbi:glycosyltransferase family 4 protein [Calothrix sp. PCC 6303]|uniref:glycosyltransferase family 4 protein n=1 Tax=Calothrix sp. PCC 6303 TaxID=1170562 RepID=UPI0002A01AAB|nr:glycosyltransferase family 4 protein [Calothrix sp. PCC 6303]AFZ01178.1 glycosyl transferase group 1 [Calothrix sp. PCC 6303]